MFFDDIMDINDKIQDDFEISNFKNQEFSFNSGNFFKTSKEFVHDIIFGILPTLIATYMIIKPDELFMSNINKCIKSAFFFIFHNFFYEKN